MAHAQSIDRDRKQVGASCSQSHEARLRGLALAFAAAGAVSFWLPDVVVHAHAGPNLDARHAWAITVLAPAMFLGAYLVARRLARQRHFKMVGPAMLLGVWLSGGLFMTLAAILSRSEFTGGTGIWRVVVIFMSVIPIVTFVLAAYDGSVFALLAITLAGLLVLGFRSTVALWNSSGTPRNIGVTGPVFHGDDSKAA